MAELSSFSRPGSVGDAALANLLSINAARARKPKPITNANDRGR